MKSVRSLTLRQAFTRRLCLSLLAIGPFAFAESAWATDPALPVMQIEEDWELVVADPDVYTDAPQVTTVLSPFGHLESLHAAFEFNHRSQPSFSAGGAQVQVWNGEDSLGVSSSNFTSELEHAGETVTWTQVMKLYDDGQLGFKVTNGHSTSWGDFGTYPWLRVSIYNTSLTTLAGYSPSVSVENSGVSYAGNRVTSLTLKSVRRYLASGELLDEVTTPVVVHPNE